MRIRKHNHYKGSKTSQYSNFEQRDTTHSKQNPVWSIRGKTSTQLFIIKEEKHELYAWGIKVITIKVWNCHRTRETSRWMEKSDTGAKIHYKYQNLPTLKTRIQLPFIGWGTTCKIFHHFFLFSHWNPKKKCNHQVAWIIIAFLRSMANWLQNLLLDHMTSQSTQPYNHILCNSTHCNNCYILYLFSPGW